MYSRLWIVVLLIALLGAACEARTSADVSQINVVATTGMIADAAKNVGGMHVAVTVLVGTGVDPHTYVLTDSDKTLLDNAQVIFYNGLGLEAGMTDVLNSYSSQKPVVAISKGISYDNVLQLPGTNIPDPHIWMDAGLWQTAIGEVRDGLTQVDPDNAKQYNANAVSYMSQMLVLNKYINDQINLIPAQKRVLVTAHDAFRYFGRAYGLDVIAPQDGTEAPANATQIQNVVQAITDNNVSTIFAETTLPQDTLNAIISAAGGRGQTVSIGGTLYSDATWEESTGRPSYDGMMRYNVDTIVKALSG